MKHLRILATALAAAALLTGCGGSDPGNQTPPVAYTRLVSFGDSLSDVGTYRTELVALNGEGMYSINGDFAKARLPGAPDGLRWTNWTQYVAASLHLPAPCAAETGLDSPSTGPLAFMAEAPAFHDAAPTSCSNYAQGGARVTSPQGVANRYWWDTHHDTTGLLGQLTVPVAVQVDNFRQHTGGFTATDLVTVMAGGNDLFINRGTVDGTAAAVAGLPQDQQDAAVAQAADAAVQAMADAGDQLATLVLQQMVANGATHVVVVNLPDVAKTPDQAAWLLKATSAEIEKVHPGLTLDLVTTFNQHLAAGLSVAGGDSSNAAVLWVDAFTNSDAYVANPGAYGLTNVTQPACQLDTTQQASTGLFVPSRVPIASSLFCTKNTLATDEVSAMTFFFADTVHPTPYGYRLLAQLVDTRLATRGWL